mmetsp:Transcript_29916/g.68983  ORF Transcript_29916/g.68983 Transcript_29916/m.68983 type:complete len:132 (+) Transcript_29916:69-464(+)
MARAALMFVVVPALASALMSVQHKEAVSAGESDAISNRYGLLPVEDQMLMNETLMLESTLPRGARHVSGSTMAADWLAEYQLEAAPAVETVVKSVSAEETTFRGGTQLLCLLCLVGAASVLSVLSVMAHGK